MTIANTYTKAYDFSEGYAVVGNDDKYGLIDKSGAVVLEIKYGSLSNVVNGLMYFTTTESAKVGYINIKGQIIIPQEYDQISNVQLSYPLTDDGYIVIRQNGKYGVLNSKGHYIVNPYLIDVNF